MKFFSCFVICYFVLIIFLINIEVFFFRVDSELDDGIVGFFEFKIYVCVKYWFVDGCDVFFYLVMWEYFELW